jgi:hypothetical protein
MSSELDGAGAETIGFAAVVAAIRSLSAQAALEARFEMGHVVI